MLTPQQDPEEEPYDMGMELCKLIDVFFDGGLGTLSSASSVELAGERPEVIRRGVGDVSAYSKALTSPTPRRMTSGCSPDKSTMLVVLNVPSPPSIKTSIRLPSSISIS